jgi:hypothetical protein
MPERHIPSAKEKAVNAHHKAIESLEGFGPDYDATEAIAYALLAISRRLEHLADVIEESNGG